MLSFGVRFRFSPACWWCQCNRVRRQGIWLRPTKLTSWAPIAPKFGCCGPNYGDISSWSSYLALALVKKKRNKYCFVFRFRVLRLLQRTGGVHPRVMFERASASEIQQMQTGRFSGSGIRLEIKLRSDSGFLNLLQYRSLRM